MRHRKALGARPRRTVWRILIACLLAACEPTINTTLVVADGWEDTPPSFLLGPTDCAPRAGDPVIEATPSGTWRAHTGTTRVPCKDGAISVTVAPIATFVLRAPTAIAIGSDATAEVVATSAAGTPLRLDRRVVWSSTGTVPITPRNDMDLIGPAIQLIEAPQLFHFRGGAPGSATLHVQWHERSAETKLAIQ